VTGPISEWPSGRDPLVRSSVFDELVQPPVVDACRALRQLGLLRELSRTLKDDVEPEPRSGRQEMLENWVSRRL
jgi:hypothetical protein